MTISRSRNIAHHSSSVRSGCSATSANSTAACFSSGELLPPCRLAANSPVARQRCTQRIAELSLTPNRSPAACRVAPALTASTTRARKSKEYGFAIPIPHIEGYRIAKPQYLVNLRFIGAEIRSKAQIGVQIGPYGVGVGAPYYGPGPYYYGYGPYYHHHYRYYDW